MAMGAKAATSAFADPTRGANADLVGPLPQILAANYTIL